MCDVFDGIGLSVSVVIGGIDTPFVAGAVMFGMTNSVHDRVTEEHVSVAHIDFCAEYVGAVGEFAGAHAAEEIEIFGDGSIAPGAIDAGFHRGSSAGANFFQWQAADVGEPIVDQFFGP